MHVLPAPPAAAACTLEDAERALPPLAQLVSAAVTVAEAALGAIDLRAHDATHPRLGAVDHISCHPVPASLGGCSGSRGGSASSGGGSGRAGSGDHASTSTTTTSGSSSSGGAGSGSALVAAAHVARGIGQRLSCGPTALSVYYYGSAHPQQRRLADVRRELGGWNAAARLCWARDGVR